MNLPETEPWNPTDATYALREIGKHPALSVAYKVHATQRLAKRGIIVSDILYLLRTGFVYSDARQATQPGYFKYQMEGLTPNSAGRRVGAVVIPNAQYMTVKVVTVFWVDETGSKAGTLAEGNQ